jgi:hypothetical protein
MQISFYAVGAVGASIAIWYFYQIASRKKARVRYKLRLIAIYIGVAVVSFAFLKSQRIEQSTAGIFSILAGCGVAYLVTKPPKQSRRIPKAIRDAVIARDLTAKGLKWDSTKYHIDHKVPFSRGGDNSIRNLEVKEKKKNLSKGAKMPGVREFLR